jgi:hypothetical protein
MQTKIFSEKRWVEYLMLKMDVFCLVKSVNVGKTMPFALSTSHHHFYKWYKQFQIGGL